MATIRTPILCLFYIRSREKMLLSIMWSALTTLIWKQKVSTNSSVFLKHWKFDPLHFFQTITSQHNKHCNYIGWKKYKMLKFPPYWRTTLSRKAGHQLQITYKKCNFWHFKKKIRGSVHLLYTKTDEWDYLRCPIIIYFNSCFDFGEGS